MGFPIKPYTKEEFFKINSVNCLNSFLAKKSYILLHTIYLRNNNKIKSEMGMKWREYFDLYMANETYEYMYQLEPLMLNYNMQRQIKQGEAFQGLRILLKSVIALEFDLWLIERYKKMPINIQQFEAYIYEKYEKLWINNPFKRFKEYDLYYINSFEEIAKELKPNYNKILEIYNLVINNNKKNIKFANQYAERTKQYILEKEILENKTLDSVNKMEIVSETHDNTFTTAQTSDTNSITDREIKIIINEKDERIKELEDYIREVERQRNETREYSNKQYEKGIKDLFSIMNDIKYGKVIDYLFSIHKLDTIDKKLKSYLENLFISFEEIGIEPICKEISVINKETILKDFNLQFDKSEFDANKIKLKYTGWKYKGVPIEKPTLTQEDN